MCIQLPTIFWPKVVDDLIIQADPKATDAEIESIVAHKVGLTKWIVDYYLGPVHTLATFFHKDTLFDLEIFFKLDHFDNILIVVCQ